MITKREVLDAISRCEPHSGWGPLDRAPVSVAAGDIAVLVEAAKATKYRNIAQPFESKEFVLDDGEGAIRGAYGQ